MTANRFRNLALAFPDAIESSHMNHPDFRVNGIVFATLGHPNDGWAMVKLTADQQASVIAADSDSFQPCSGSWGRSGYTNMRLASVDVSVAHAALEAAFENIA